ncbi:glycosyltransferase [Desulfovibrio legallii]|uniref:Glycosyltransferase n=1 Tax=Desulfovibrio legallii TaxID=571438 RepID=A0A6H3F8B3_9BACT|nr:glycosyltransferase [Desulfovibrio legallii]
MTPYNMGKRHALAAGALRAKFDLLVFVDSDSFLEPEAVREVVQPFCDPKMGAVSGRTEVQNKWTNALTKMQAVRYYVAFRFMKAAEAVFDGVTCLSGPLACYRKDLVLRYLDDWLNQKFFGYPATFGDDRSLTNFILAHHRTGYQDAAVCSTIVPSRMRTFMKQQMRWKRSWLRETLRASSFMWRKEPFMALSFYAGFLLPVLAPLVVVRTMLVIPIELGLFPYKYLAGILVTSTLMSASYLLFKRSTLWPYGIIFCLFYLAVLLWQLPVAVLTFWKSEWGTRNTSADVAAQGKRRYEQKMFVMPSDATSAEARHTDPCDRKAS